jgi:hypothetical protein|tara:strand:- start:570 stop:764 length:195 start_codon:yes stop_codon:yes gene_type:complete
MQSYVVNLLDKYNNHKTKVVQAKNIKDAQKLAEKNYPSYEVTRITPDKMAIEYYRVIKQEDYND